MRRLIQSFLSIFLIVLIGCQIQAKEPDYLEYVDELISSFTQEMSKDHGFVCIGTGGRLATNVDSIEILFDIYHKATIEEARELMLIAMNKLVDKVNAHEKIRPFLKECPFTWRSAHIVLSFERRDGSRYLDDTVSFVCQGKDGEIVYKKAELQTRKNYGLVDKERGINIPEKTVEIEVLVPLLKETYEEALRIANSK